LSANTYLPPSPVFPPSLVITNITQAVNAVITHAVPIASSPYIIGQLIKLTIPPEYGMYQADQMTCEILAVDNLLLTFTTSLDTTFFNAFVIPVGIRQQKPASLAPAGSRNLYNISTVAFHSLDGSVGN